MLCVSLDYDSIVLIDSQLSRDGMHGDMKFHYANSLIIYLELCLSNARLASAQFFEVSDGPLPKRAKEIMDALEAVRGPFESTRRIHYRFISEQSRRSEYDMGMIELSAIVIKARNLMRDGKHMKDKSFLPKILTDDQISTVAEPMKG